MSVGWFPAGGDCGLLVAVVHLFAQPLERDATRRPVGVVELLGRTVGADLGDHFGVVLEVARHHLHDDLIDRVVHPCGRSVAGLDAALHQPEPGVEVGVG